MKQIQESVYDIGYRNVKEKRKIEYVGLSLVAVLVVLLFFKPEWIGGAFTAMVEKVQPTVVNVFLTGSVGVAIILSVMTGRILERLGFTDALIRLFVPITKKLGINPTVVIPGLYHIVGDINAAGRIAGPILKKAHATKDEQKIAVATMVQCQQSFSCFLLGLIALSAAGINAFPVVVLTIFAPLFVVPWVLSKTLWRNTKTVNLKDLPSFTPHTPLFPTVFNGAKEGAELLFLFVIPAIAVIYGLIGILDFAGIWHPIETGMSTLFGWIGVHPATGITAVMASPTLAMDQMKSIAADLDPRFVVGAFVLSASGLPLSDIFGQIPAIWSANSDLSAKEALSAAVIGMLLRLITVLIMALGLTPLLS
ncbi:hypothetical protein SAMN04488137_1752 [Fictibacillus solisalsi]|uniref:Nucleoside recognition n=1 Tax=Fictibacillus solisalsi TaxID=459525 RepID=A0A1G9VRY5_9BACL|nr:hypothetical protein [Fictibacillus solisalsi]SDM74826.1 hypothetical protein SAMN04488137_1752 [Fictibacillus solisalsi]